MSIPGRRHHATIMCRKAFRLVFVLLFWVLPRGHAEPVVLDQAQVEQEYLQKSWNVESGLPDKRVTALLQSRDGYMWIGTQSGIARFDGQRFTVYNHANTPQMASDYCQRIIEDFDGNLWFSFFLGGRLIRKSGPDFRAILPQGPVRSFDNCGMLASRAGGIWCCAGRNLCRIQSDALRYYPLPQDVPGDLIPLREQQDGSLVLGSWTMSVHFDLKGESFEKLPFVADAREQTGLAMCPGPMQQAWMLAVTGVRSSIPPTIDAHICKF